jgi:membrane-bound serine protease (ClpP class)
MNRKTVNEHWPLACWIRVLALLCLSLPLQASAQGAVLLLDIKGAIGPASSDYVHRGLEQARVQHAPLVILRMDTPGGLDAAMRDIIHDILAAAQPVVSYVAPGGARAASAGTYILYASHVAAMAPGTNLGAATPVQIGAMPGSGKLAPEEPEKSKDKDNSAPQDADSGDAMQHKIVNDAVAYIRSLAQLRGRNADWAEQAVRTAASLPADEALKKNVIDLIATDVPDLLTKLDGRTLTMLGTQRTLSTKGLAVETVAPDWRSKLLAVITDPNVAYILMLIGIYGLFFEFANPGYVLPGVTGAICLVLALYAFQVLPVNYAGLGLILLGIMFMTAEAFVPSGALGFGGVIAFAIGSVILFDTGTGGMAVSYALIGAVALLSALFFVFIVGMALRARRRPVVSGSEELIGMLGEALEDFSGAGLIRVHSESWQARCDQPVRRGQQVRVTGRDGLTLVVQPATKEH